MRKKIAVVAMRARLRHEKGHIRFCYICELLAASGYQVDLFTSTFGHYEKKRRDIEAILREAYPFHIRFIQEPGYQKDFGLTRLYSHKAAADHLRQMLEKEGNYDLIYAEMPPNNVALAAAEYAEKKKIPFVADITGLWPEMLQMNWKFPLVPPLSTLIRRHMRQDAMDVCSLAWGVISTSDSYREGLLKKQERKIPVQTVYPGNEITLFDRGAADNMDTVFKNENEFWVTYAGALGISYDIRTLLLAAEELEMRGRLDIRFKILGYGPMGKELEELANAKQIYSVEFVGYVPYGKMAAYLKKSDILVNASARKSQRSVATKLGEYLSAGKAVINICASEELKAKVTGDGFGVNVVPGNAAALADAVEDLYEGKEMRLAMGLKARKVAEEQFDRPKSYQKIIEMIQMILKEKENRS